MFLSGVYQNNQNCYNHTLLVVNKIDHYIPGVTRDRAVLILLIRFRCTIVKERAIPCR